MNNLDFIKAWCVDGDRVNKFDSKEVDALGLSESTKSFLKSGLPAGASPFLNFCPCQGGKFKKRSLPTLSETYNLNEPFNRYRIIGSDGSGNPICLDMENEEVFHLDHEDNFKPTFMNSSVQHLTQFLLEIRNSAEKLETKSGYYEVLEKLNKIDKKAIKNSKWWVEELKTLLD